MRAARLAALLILALPCGPAVSATRQLVAPLDDQTAIDGCSWKASSPGLGSGSIFLAEPDDSLVLMNIDGSDVELRPAGEHGSLSRVGDVLVKTFSAPGVRVTARFEAVWICPPHDEVCEVTRYEVEFHVAKGEQIQQVKATGSFGC